MPHTTPKNILLKWTVENTLTEGREVAGKSEKGKGINKYK